MTDEHQSLQIAAQIARGDEALRAGEELLRIHLYADALSRLYYAAFHFASAALLTEEISATSHQGLQTLFSLHLVRTGKLPPSLAKDLRRLQAFREAADYNVEFVVDREGAEEEAVVARRFVLAVRAYLDTARTDPSP